MGGRGTKRKYVVQGKNQARPIRGKKSMLRVMLAGSADVTGKTQSLGGRTRNRGLYGRLYGACSYSKEKVSLRRLPQQERIEAVGSAA